MALDHTADRGVAFCGLKNLSYSVAMYFSLRDNRTSLITAMPVITALKASHFLTAARTAVQWNTMKSQLYVWQRRTK